MNIAKLLGSTSLLVGAMIAFQAQAATVNNVTLTGASSTANGGGTCLVTADIRITGNVADDKLIRDFFQIGGETAAGQRFNIPSIQSALVSQTVTRTQTVAITVSANPSNNYAYVIPDVTSNTTAANADPVISSTPILPSLGQIR